MADGMFNIAKGLQQTHGALGAANDAFVVVLLQAAESDDVLKDYTTLSALLGAAGNTEATFTNYGRRSVTSATSAVDHTQDRWTVDFADQTWASAGGATNNTIVKLLVCFDGDTTSGTDANIVPVSFHDFPVTTNGSTLTAQFSTSGVFGDT